MRYFFFISAMVLLSACTDSPKNPTTGKQSSRSSTDSEQQIKLEELNRMIVDQPNDPEVYRLRARFHYRNNNPSSAIEDMNRAVRLDSNNAEILFERGELFYNLLRFERAKEDYERCVRANKDAVDCLLKLGELHIHLRNYSQAVESINNALRVNQQLPFAYYMKGRIYKETGDTLLAASSYQTAIEVDPDYYDAYIEVGLLYTAAKSDLAIEYFNTALEIKPNSVEAMYNLAYYLTISGVKRHERFDQAFDLYDRILSVDPSNATAPYNKGFIYLEHLQEYDSAAHYFKQATRLLPSYFQAHYNLGLSLESLDRPAEALVAYNEALRLQPDYTPAAIAKGRVLGE